MLSAIELQDRIRQLLQGSLAIDLFEDWMTRESWDMHRSADQTIESIVGAVELCLAEFGMGHLGMDEFRSELQTILDSCVPVSMYRKTSEHPHKQVTYYSKAEPKTEISSRPYPMSVFMALDPDGRYIQIVPEAWTVLEAERLRIPLILQAHGQDRYDTSKPQTPVIRIH
ncbi:MAG: hypothetical protein OXN97_25250 [Bryobacterales bacterium]|nr:hypothetical protein [Bryobacterales bacterium]